jgi:pyridoxine/pyridoxamine 5'-phosphate oxidase
MTTPRPVKVATVYDKTRPDGEQTVAEMQGVDVDGRGFVVFTCQQSQPGVSVLSKQHAIEFASCLLMLALGLPGDVPAGDCGVATETPEES